MQNEVQATNTIIQEPYVGPRPFEEMDEAIFFGREHEATELSSCIISHPIVLLYSQSGAGKTSLLKASLIPLLRRRKIEVLPPVRVRGKATHEFEIPDHVNIYIYNAISYLSDKKINLNDNKKISIKDYLPEKKIEEKRGITPIRVLIIDQFEELFTLYADRFENRQGFFEQISSLLKEDPLLRIVLAMREDYIAELDPYAPILPEKLQTRYRLLRLNEDAARAAIEKPIEKANEGQLVQYVFEPDALDKIIDNLRTIYVKKQSGEKQVLGSYIEPVHLQVACQNLWRKLKPTFEQKAKEGATELIITENNVEEFGDINKALSEFYESGIQKAIEVANSKIKKPNHLSEGVIRLWFEQTLITPEGTRSTVFCSRKDETITGIPKIAIRELENQRLIRAEFRGGETWYELSHDRLIQPIRKSNGKWLLTLPEAQKIKQELETSANLWFQSGKSKDLLLKHSNLQKAKEWKKSPESNSIGYSDRLLAYLEASRLAEQKKRIKLIIWGVLVLIILLVITGWSAVKAIQQSELAEQKTRFAEQQRIIASEYASKANINYGKAQREAEVARISEQKARMSAIEAELARSEAIKNGKIAKIERDIARRATQRALLEQTRAMSAKREAEIKTEELQRTLIALRKESEQVKRGYQTASSIYSPNDEFVLSVSEDKKAAVFDTKTGNLIASLKDSIITTANFNQRSNLLATANLENVISLWSIQNKEIKLSNLLKSHHGRIRKLVFSINDKYLASASDDSTVIVWEVYTGRKLYSFDHEGPVVDIAFSTNGREIYTTTSNGKRRTWEIGSGRLSNMSG